MRAYMLEVDDMVFDGLLFVFVFFFVDYDPPNFEPSCSHDC